MKNRIKANINNQRKFSKKLSWNLTSAFFVILFIGDLFSGLGVIPQIAPDLASLFLKLMLLAIAVNISSQKNIPFRLPGILPVFYFLIFSVISAFINGQGAAEIIVFFRAVFGQYLLFIALVNIRFTPNDFKKINRIIFFLCAIQIPVALYRLITSGADIFLTGGERSFGIERAAGTFGRAGGSMGTTFPLIVIGFLLAFYLWEKKKKYIFWTLGFIFFSLCTGKRAFPIVLPFFLITLNFFISDRANIFSKKNFLFTSIGVLGLIAGIYLTPSLNPSQRVGGEIQLKFAFDKALNYETSVTWQGKPAGRYSTSKYLVKRATGKGILTFLFGEGPGRLIKSGLIESKYDANREEMNIAYGITGAGWLFHQVGLAGLFCFLWLIWIFFKRVARFRLKLVDPYWRSICGGLIGLHLVMIFDTIAYSTTSAVGKVIPALWFFFMAQLLSYQKADRIH